MTKSFGFVSLPIGFGFATFVVGVFGVLGCSFDGSNSANSDGGTIDASVPRDALIDGQNPDATNYGFRPGFTEWKVPDSNTLGGFFSVESASSDKSWFLMDMTKDGIIDLVQTQDPGNSQVWRGVAGPYWKVFPGQTDRFSDTPIEWAVPTTSYNFGYNRKTGDVASERWGLIDLTGDGCPDFVKLLDPSDGSIWLDVVQPYWEVYACGAAGFSSTPVVWQVPDPVFDRLENCDSATGCWGIRNLIGTRAQLIHTSGIGPKVPFTDPMPFWQIYESTNTTGFDSGPVRWGIPVDVESASTFHRLDSANAGSFWQLLDLNGDNKLQLVQSRPFSTVGTPTVFNLSGNPGWKVYDSNTTSGFEGEVSWRVPVTDHVGGFFSISREEPALRWAVLDLNGDQRPDLVHTANTQIASDAIWKGSEGHFWKVYFGSDSGGSFVPGVDWAVPDPGTSAGFYSIAQNAVGEHWVLIDLDGDNQVELIQTSVPSTNEVWTNSSTEPIWRVYSAN